MNTNLSTLLDKARTPADIFEVVKSAVWKCLEKSRGGLMLGMANLGNHPGMFLGAFYPVGSNVIVMNKIPLARIKETRPELYKPYIFHVLLHEYLHSLGYLNEDTVRSIVTNITRTVMGESHPATLIAAETTRYFRNLVYPDIAWQPDDLSIELVQDFDRSSASYVA